MTQRIKLETVEEKQLPRWVYAMMKANQDPNAEPDESDGPKRYLLQLKAKEFLEQRKARLAEQALASSRYSGLEWRNRPKTTFNSEELDKILPTRRVSYVASRSFFTTFVISLVVLATLATLSVGIAVCAEIKLGVSAGEAWAMFTASPVGYYHHVVNAFDW